MTGWRPTARAVVAAVAVSAALPFAFLPRAGANPEVCGYVRYSPNDTDPTQTVPYVPYCERPCGTGVWQPPGEVNDVHYEALVCVKGL